MLDGIICDEEGRIKNISDNYSKILQYDHNNMLQKRIFTFFDKSVILDILQQWQNLVTKNNKENVDLTISSTMFRTTTNLCFTANLSITRQDDTHYLLKINPINSNDIINVDCCSNNLKLTLVKKIKMLLLIIRASFLLATFIPIIFAVTWSLQYIAITKIFSWLFLAVFVGSICCHIAANVFNDYFDWQSGADQINTNFIFSISGGSRATEFGIIGEKKLFQLAMINLLIAASCALYITLNKGPLIIILSIFGAFSIYFYTAPSIRLAAKYGLGELCIFLCFGPILIAGTIYVFTNNINWESFLIGSPLGLLITSILLINEYPDLAADAAAKKTNLAVLLGHKYLPFAVSALIISCYITMIIGIAIKVFPKIYVLSMLTLPLAIYEIMLTFKMQQNRKLIYKACITNIKLYAVFGLTCIIAGIIQLI